MKNVLIAGIGNIGSSLYREYGKLAPDRYDPYKGYNEKRDIWYDFAFIATDTPISGDGSCDLSQVRQALDETDAEVYVLRSTVPPSTTEKLRQEIGCSKLQGYFFCKPIPFEEIVERYEKNIQIGFEGLSFVPGYVHYLRRIENPRNPCGI